MVLALAGWSAGQWIWRAFQVGRARPSARRGDARGLTAAVAAVRACSAAVVAPPRIAPRSLWTNAPAGAGWGAGGAGGARAGCWWWRLGGRRRAQRTSSTPLRSPSRTHPRAACPAAIAAQHRHALPQQARVPPPEQQQQQQPNRPHIAQHIAQHIPHTNTRNGRPHVAVERDRGAHRGAARAHQPGAPPARLSARPAAHPRARRAEPHPAEPPRRWPPARRRSRPRRR
jgi:hypothetical protein